MSNLVKLPPGVSVTVGGRTFRGECPENFYPQKHRAAKPEVKKPKEDGKKG